MRKEAIFSHRAPYANTSHCRQCDVTVLLTHKEMGKTDINQPNVQYL
jgi:hypothetical protein